MDELPAVLQGVDLLAVLGVEVVEDADVAELRRGLRRTFLRRAKECHPDKQKPGSKGSDTSLEFARLKAAFDYLQRDDVFATLYNRALHKKREEKARKERTKGISAKQAAHLDALLRREREAAEAAAARREQFHPEKPSQRGFQASYEDMFDAHAASSSQAGPASQQGMLFVAARTMKIANEAELNCLLLSDHFSNMFANFGLLRVQPIDITETAADAVNVKVGILVFQSHEHALKALLHYRKHRSNFRCDLYALALKPQGDPAASAASADGASAESESLEDMEALVLSRLRQAAAKRRKLMS
ncbi:hypothetical protein, conserved [Babesia bigemina]|uniref:J domain-containing protein n=1 Tax=Babesia bigemina TaxID=5866 RepID=A0A061DA45_BABBI|nr:hypothetical protein, conserved [Babesia bigemina]CDR97403.1 hypothetical protein, conserved [Babesia bigemina]|eukprot:XP_012769589.1 hypothetical protein, conserved [Babesia bigemina]